MPIRRTLKNVVKNYSDAQIKVREATSNDAWGPSTTLMSEIADLTYNVVAYAEIMPILWRRLEDSGRNWRHVYKSLVLLDYLVRTGSERVARECRERAWAIQAIADSFEFAEAGEGPDRGAGVRERARALTALLRDDDRLRNERAKALKARERFAQNSIAVSAASLGASSTKYSARSVSPLHSISPFSDSGVGGGVGGYSEFGSPSLSSLEASHYGLEGGASVGLEPELESIRPTSVGEEELQLQLALAMSKEEHEEELRRLKGDEAKLHMALTQSQLQMANQSSKCPLDAPLDVESVASGISNPWKSFDHQFSPSKTLVDTWMARPPMLPPPPSAKLSSPVPASDADPWLSAADISTGTWTVQTKTSALSLKAADSKMNSARSSPWESPVHDNKSGTTAFDDEFDVLSSRLQCPQFALATPPAVPPRHFPAGYVAEDLSDPWDLTTVDSSLHAGKQLVGQSLQPNKKSAGDFLGDNANLVNFNNLISVPCTITVSGNPFTSPTSCNASPCVSMNNPFGPPPVAVNHLSVSSLPVVVSTSAAVSSGMAFGSAIVYGVDSTSYPPAYNPFL